MNTVRGGGGGRISKLHTTKTTKFGQSVRIVSIICTCTCDMQIEKLRDQAKQLRELVAERNIVS